MREFWVHGYGATSLQTLLAAMSISKSSLYQTFGSKHELFEKCLERYSDALVVDMEARLLDARSPRSFLVDTLNGIAAGAYFESAHDGCLVMNTASEFGQRDEQITHCITRGIARVTSVLRKAIQQAQASGEIALDKDAGVLADYLLSNMAGLHTRIKAGMDAKSARAIVEVTLAAVG